MIWVSSIIFLVSLTGLVLPTFYRLLLHKLPIKQSGTTTNQKETSISVIIPCYNERQNIINKVTDTIHQLPTMSCEIIVIDDGSTDSTFELLKNKFGSISNVILLQQPRLGKSAAINAAAAVSTKEWLVITDANAELEPNSIKALTPFFSIDYVGVVRGKYLPTETSSPFVPILNTFRKAEDRLFELENSRGTLHLSGGWLQAIRRSLVNIKEQRTMVEDLDLSLSAISRGYSVAYAPLAIARKKVPMKGQEIFQQNIRYTYGTIQTLIKYHKLLRPRLSTFVWLAIISGKGSQSFMAMWLTFLYLAFLLLIATVWTLPFWIVATLFFGLYTLLFAFFLAFPKITLSKRPAFLTTLEYLVAVFFAELTAYWHFFIRRGANGSGWKPVQSIRV